MRYSRGTSTPRPPCSVLNEAENADGVDQRKDESPPQAGANQPQPCEMNEGAAQQRDEQAIATGRFETQDAVARRAARRDIFPKAHAEDQQRDGGEEGSRLPGPRHPGKIRQIRHGSNPPEGEALGDVVADKPDDECAGDQRQNTGGGEQAPIHAGGGNRARHGGGNRLGVGGGQCAGNQKLHPREHEAEEAGDPDAGGNQRHEDLHEEFREGVAVNIGGLVNVLRHTRHEAFENPHGQRYVEQAVRQRHRDMRVDQAEGRIELEEGQGEDGGRCHAVGQKPEEQMLVAKKPIARKCICCRQSYGDRNHHIHNNIYDRVNVARVP